MPTTTPRFPYPDSEDRLKSYAFYNRLLKGRHYEAFLGEAGTEFSDRYKHLRYVVGNYAGLVSKVCADFLFGEPVQIRGEANQDWIEALLFNNRINTQFYESALHGSALGDVVFRIRVENDEILVEEVNPSMYFPIGIDGNFRQRPAVEELAWVEPRVVDGKDQDYLIRETHGPGSVSVSIFTLDKRGKIGLEVAVDEYNEMFGTKYVQSVETGIDRNLLFHVPNFRPDFSFFGASDYADLTSLIFALNNRITKTDNVLDRHTDPILAVPEGTLDENGEVKKEALGLFEMGEDGKKPEYVVWNASLESAFTEIEKLLELLFMFSEVSPDVLGMGRGQSDSGRALKLKLIRTIAKKKRKELYYTQGIQEMLLVAQMLAAANPKYTTRGEALPSKTPELVEVVFDDGVADDIQDILDVEAKKLEVGITSKKRAIMKLEGVTEEQADRILGEVDAEKPPMPSFLAGPVDNIEKNQKASQGGKSGDADNNKK